jgi:hypothetical protein
LDPSSYLWSSHREFRFPRVIHSRRKVLGALPSDAITFNDATNTFGGIDIKSFNQYDSIFDGMDLFLAAETTSLCNPLTLAI